MRASLRFVVPSACGVLLFLTPLPWDGNLTIGIDILRQAFKALLGPYVLHLVVGLLVLTSVLTIAGTIFKFALIARHSHWKALFDVPLIWLALRLLGALFGVFYLLQVGPSILISEGVGGAVFAIIAVEVMSIYILASLLMPLLTNYGFMEFVGTLARPVFRRVFRLPGRSAIDAVTSFVGASSIGLLITISQYDSGKYTAREACTIATNFSVVSIPFALVVATVAGVGHLFVGWYGTVVLACLTAVLVTSRLPPLSNKPDLTILGDAREELDSSTDYRGLLHEAWSRALQQADQSPGGREYLSIAISSMMFFLFSVLAAAMALATLATLVTFHTPVFTWLSYPAISLLELLRLPDAAAAAPGLLAGFLDQYMPAIIAGRIDSEVTSFVLAGLAVCQLIFVSEVVVIILRSSLPLGFVELLGIFLLRTLIVLPILVVCAHLVAG